MNWTQIGCLAGFLGPILSTGSLIAAAFTGGATLVIAGVGYSVSTLSMIFGCG